MDTSREDSTEKTEAPAAHPEFARLLMIKKNDVLVRRMDARQNLDQQTLDSPGDEADTTAVDTSADYFLKLTNTLQDELREIDAAFERISRGTYGQCESCGEMIGRARLRHLPEARLCIDCQAKTERDLRIPGSVFQRSRQRIRS